MRKYLYDLWLGNTVFRSDIQIVALSLEDANTQVANTLKEYQRTHSNVRIEYSKSCELTDPKYKNIGDMGRSWE